MKYLAMKHKMIEHVIKHPFQTQIQATAATVTEQFQAHDFPKRRIEEVDDGSHQRLNMVFYVAYQFHFISNEIKNNLTPRPPLHCGEGECSTRGLPGVKT